MTWQPSLGAWCHSGKTHFRVWAPQVEQVELVLGGIPRESRPRLLSKDSDGYFCGSYEDITPGDLYQYLLDGRGPFPDPATRFQPSGVHGPSQVIDSKTFAWEDAEWPGVELIRLVLYELHVGTFTTGGSFKATAERLPYLRDLGITGIELMPIADFDGQHNWGYDGVDLFSPARCYGSPQELRELINQAHRLGLAVFLDVVYNHLGPAGAYVEEFSPFYFSKDHSSPWGPAINLDGPQNQHVRAFLNENALYWIHEYHFDGLRLDATHALVDKSPRPWLSELTSAVHSSQDGTSRHIHLIAEDSRNLAHLVKPQSEQGWGLNGVWSNDFHHQMRRCLVNEQEGFFRCFVGSAHDIAETVRKGWFFHGQHFEFWGKNRGTDPSGIPPYRFVIFLQNHDQIGNRPFGERLHHQIDLAAYRAVSILLLLASQTPLLFMGQEWAAGSPFLFFTDHEAELGKKITEGRRREFSHFKAFQDSETFSLIPAPQDPLTFLKSRLVWEETGREPHESVLRLYRRLLKIRRQEFVSREVEALSSGVFSVGEYGLILLRQGSAGRKLLILIWLRGSGIVSLPEWEVPECNWERVMTTEDVWYAPDPLPPQIQLSPVVVSFQRPGAVILESGGSHKLG
jgi:maltooligosyltrehalose trehalohydrolase